MKLNYKEAIDLGFKRIDLEDSVWFDIYGYKYFLVHLNLTKNLYIDWDNETHEIVLIIHDHNSGNILSKIPIDDMKKFNNLIKLFKK